MKKMIRLGLCLGLLSAALTCTALAADDEYTTNIDGTVTYEGGSYSASYSGAQEGKQYALLVVEGTPDKYSVSEDTIVYIDQQQATETGVSFNHWIPMSTPDCVVLLGGVFDGNVPSPVVLGTLEGQGVTVSGTVKYQTVGTMFRPATVELHNEQGSLIAQTQTDVNGKYSFASIPVGKGYKIVIKKLGYLTYTDVGINILDTCTLTEIDISNIGGDINGDGAVYANDFQMLLEDYNKTSGLVNTASDINGDGAVYANDFSILLSGFNKTGQ